MTTTTATAATTAAAAAATATATPPGPGSRGLVGLSRASSEVGEGGALKSSPEEEALRWVEAVTTCEPPGAGEGLQQWLRSGVVLCELANTIAPGSVGRVSSSAMPFKQMENINAYTDACRRLGVPAQDLFVTVDLFEGKNMPAVVRNLHSLGRVAQAKGFAGPSLGAKLSSRNPRQFSEAQLNEARAMPARWTNRGNTLDVVDGAIASPPLPAATATETTADAGGGDLFEHRPDGGWAGAATGATPSDGVGSGGIALFGEGFSADFGAFGDLGERRGNDEQEAAEADAAANVPPPSYSPRELREAAAAAAAAAAGGRRLSTGAAAAQAEAAAAEAPAEASAEAEAEEDRREAEMEAAAAQYWAADDRRVGSDAAAATSGTAPVTPVAATASSSRSAAPMAGEALQEVRNDAARRRKLALDPGTPLADETSAVALRTPAAVVQVKPPKGSRRRKPSYGNGELAGPLKLKPRFVSVSANGTKLLLAKETMQPKLSLPLTTIVAMRAGPALLPTPAGAETPWLHLSLESDSMPPLELIAPDANALFVLVRGLAALLPPRALPRLGEVAWARARLIVRAVAERQRLTYVQAWTQIIVEAAAGAATATPSRLAHALEKEARATPTLTLKSPSKPTSVTSPRGEGSGSGGKAGGKKEKKR